MQQLRQPPAITFRAEPPLVVALPRMDVAAFVGFAPRGPVNTPVPVEDYRRFEDIFGGIYRLAWDDETAVWQTACLAPAVKDFFAQGGRRCWVVRVAGTALTNQFPVAGLLQTGPASYAPVWARASSAGSWSDGLQVGAGVLNDGLQVATATARPGNSFTLTAVPRRGSPVVPGDLLQIDFADDPHRAYVALQSADIATESGITQLTAAPARTFWFRKVTADLSGMVVGGEGVTGNFDVTTMTLTVDGPMALSEGDWVTLVTTDGRAWLLVAQARGNEIVMATAWLEGAADGIGNLNIAQVLRVQMALQVREAPGRYRAVPDVAFSAPHARYIGDLPDDATLFDPAFGSPRTPQANPSAELWDAVQNPRFPIHVPLNDKPVIIPLGLEAAPVWRGAVPTEVDPLVRDGLVADEGAGETWPAFWERLYLDPVLRRAGQRSLTGEANDRLYIQNVDLTGLHALFPVEEISMVTLPDAAHRGWRLVQRETVDDSEPAPETPVDPCAREGPFASKPSDTPDEIEDDTAALPAITSTEERPMQWKLESPLAYDSSGLLNIQTKLAELAAARGDFVALLGLPKHFQTPDALQHQRDLSVTLARAGERTASYVALYHPWLVSREANGDLLHTAPTGAVSGVMAARSLTRGAWVAPANVAVRGTLALLPSIDTQDETVLYRAGINLIQPGGGAFVIWGANTQSADVELEALNVRRLLILLRRIALIEGQSYAFAPHSPAFRRRVKQAFESRLALLFAQGAFAGRDPAEAYEVVIDETINTPASIEQGRLIVELRVAPSRPITFILVRLVQAESGLMTIQEVVSGG